MKNQNRFENLIHWIRSQITLRRAWYFYSLSFFIFIILSICYRNSYWFQLGFTLFSILIVYLVMVTSNIELRETTEKQVKAFVDNIQTVSTELKNVFNGISTLTNVMKQVERAILESTLVSKTAVARAEEEKRKRKESIKPKLSIKVEIKGFQFWIFDNRHYHLIVRNYGSDAIQTIFGIGKWDYGPHDIRINILTDVNIGPINKYKGISKLNVLIKLRDVDRNPYQANIQVSLPQPQEVSVPLTER